ncbi:hypothetical protein JCM8208_007697 [Rhodotorula glutinis]
MDASIADALVSPMRRLRITSPPRPKPAALPVPPHDDEPDDDQRFFGPQNKLPPLPDAVHSSIARELATDRTSIDEFWAGPASDLVSWSSTCKSARRATFSGQLWRSIKIVGAASSATSGGGATPGAAVSGSLVDLERAIARNPNMRPELLSIVGPESEVSRRFKTHQELCIAERGGRHLVALVDHLSQAASRSLTHVRLDSVELYHGVMEELWSRLEQHGGLVSLRLRDVEAFEQAPLGSFRQIGVVLWQLASLQLISSDLHKFRLHSIPLLAPNLTSLVLWGTTTVTTMDYEALKGVLPQLERLAVKVTDGGNFMRCLFGHIKFIAEYFSPASSPFKLKELVVELDGQPSPQLVPALKGLPSLEALAIIRAGDMSALELGNIIAAAPKLDMLLLFGGGGSEPFKWPSGPRQAWLDKLHGLPELVFFAWDRQGSRDSSKRQRRTDASTQQSRSNEGPTLEAIGKACRPGALQQTTLAAAFCLEGSDEDGSWTGTGAHYPAVNSRGRFEMELVKEAGLSLFTLFFDRWEALAEGVEAAEAADA